MPNSGDLPKNLTKPRTMSLDLALFGNETDGFYVKNSVSIERVLRKPGVKINEYSGKY